MLQAWKPARERTMGAWGAGIFENDEALDWAAEFLDAPSPSALHRAFQAVIKADSDLDADSCSAALAAAEVVAAAKGNATTDLPDELRDWATQNASAATSALIGEAVAAIDRIGHASELRDLWSEGAEMATWTLALDDLRVRLISGFESASE
jgi:hypothetical protein